MADVQYSSLLAEIQEKAAQEAARLSAQSEARLKQKTADLESKKQQILAKVQSEQEHQLCQLQRMLKSNLDMERRRSHLKEQESVLKEIQQRVHSVMQQKIKDKDYKEILCGWVCEAVLALPGDEFIIKTSPEEIGLLNAEMLKKICQTVADLGAGRTVSLSVNKKEHILGQGVVVSLPDNKLLFSNTIQDRLARYDSQIRTYIFETVFKTV